MSAEYKIEKALDFIMNCSQVDGAHHKAWCIDQIARILTEDDYEQFIKDACAGEDGPETYDWDVGIPP